MIANMGRYEGIVMRHKQITLLVTTALLVGVNGISGAAEKMAQNDFGEYEFWNSCAFCHGEDGKANTPVARLLKKAPPDLTNLSKKNGGVFPVDRVYRMIDGREAVAEHGTSDMPVWGDRFRARKYGAQASEHHQTLRNRGIDVPYDMEIFARSRILGLIDYLDRIQEK